MKKVREYLLVILNSNAVQRLFRILVKFPGPSSTALMLHGLLTSVVVYLLEVQLVHLTPEQWAGARGGYLFLFFALSGYCAKLVEKLRRLFEGTSSHPLRRFLADTLSLTLYKMTLYTGCLIVVGSYTNISYLKILGASFSLFLDSVCFGFLYGIFLDYFKKIHMQLKNNSQQ